eukprot:895936-Pelagomonas_calceolata.AAC.1
MRDDVRQYGWDAFKVMVVQSSMTQHAASTLERRTIASFMATMPSEGYNILKGAPMRFWFKGRK